MLPSLALPRRILLRAGYPVVSNSRNHRMDPVFRCSFPRSMQPISMPFPSSRKIAATTLAFLVTNPNCSTAGLVLVLKPLADAFRPGKNLRRHAPSHLRRRYPGVPAMDIQGNVVPFISGEEEKMELERQKLLGKWDGSRFVDAGIGLSAIAIASPSSMATSNASPSA